MTKTTKPGCVYKRVRFIVSGQGRVSTSTLLLKCWVAESMRAHQSEVCANGSADKLAPQLSTSNLWYTVDRIRSCLHDTSVSVKSEHKTLPGLTVTLSSL